MTREAANPTSSESLENDTGKNEEQLRGHPISMFSERKAIELKVGTVIMPFDGRPKLWDISQHDRPFREYVWHIKS